MIPLSLLCAALLASCNQGFNVVTPIIDANNQTSSAPVLTDYAEVQNQVIGPMCLECHSAANGNSGGVNLESYQNVFLHIVDIRADVVSGDMPASGPALTETEKTLIVGWIDSGAPQGTSASPQPTPTPNPTPLPTPTPVATPNPTPTPDPSLHFSTVYAQVIGPKCTSCHSDFSSYATVKGEISTIQSKVSSKSMPQGSSLTTAQYNTLMNWISAGSPQ
jgi:uncharacterized membrane protein